MKCKHPRCKDEATENGQCSFHNYDWQASYDRRDKEADEYEARTGRNLFWDRFTGNERR